MKALKLYSAKDVAALVNKREGEIRFGERVSTIATIEEINTNSARFALLGIPEDIGVRANMGKPGTANAWNAALTTLLNTQANTYTNAHQLLVLGEIDCDAEMLAAGELDPSSTSYLKELGPLVNEIDAKVSSIVRTIVAAGKIPILIGGGHNNAFGNIKGSAVALDKAINVINFDAHTDFRPLEHRHSGNGFSYAMHQGLMNKYAIFGLHKNYTSQEVYDRMANANDKIAIHFFEDIAIEQKLSFHDAVTAAAAFVNTQPYGVELDVDAICNFPSSARTPSGFTMNQARQFLQSLTKNKNLTYVHICEATVGVDGDAHFNVGKALAYLITDILYDS
jgi:formiminoglutamase